jgi:hypothetical protein
MHGQMRPRPGGYPHASARFRSVMRCWCHDHYRGPASADPSACARGNCPARSRGGHEPRTTGLCHHASGRRRSQFGGCAARTAAARGARAACRCGPSGSGLRRRHARRPRRRWASSGIPVGTLLDTTVFIDLERAARRLPPARAMAEVSTRLEARLEARLGPDEDGHRRDHGLGAALWHAQSRGGVPPRAVRLSSRSSWPRFPRCPSGCWPLPLGAQACIGFI